MQYNHYSKKRTTFAIFRAFIAPSLLSVLPMDTPPLCNKVKLSGVIPYTH